MRGLPMGAVKLPSLDSAAMEAPGQRSDPWALDGAGLAAVLAAIGDGRTRVIECGSGNSTVAIADALRGRPRGASRRSSTCGRSPSGRGPRWRRRASTASPRCRRAARHTGARRWPALVRGRPGSSGSAADADLLLVDGPPGDCGPASRKPALSRLAAKLSPGCLVMLDDADRPGEAEAIREWEREHRLVFERVGPRLVAGTLG